MYPTLTLMQRLTNLASSFFPQDLFPGYPPVIVNQVYPVLEDLETARKVRGQITSKKIIKYLKSLSHSPMCNRWNPSSLDQSQSVTDGSVGRNRHTSKTHAGRSSD
jgi:hypothetical protein